MKFILDKNYDRKIFHYGDCKFVNKIRKEDRLVFSNKEFARDLGYTCCPRCSRIIKYYNQDKKEIDKFIKIHHMKMYIEDDAMYIDNNTVSNWKIIVNPANVAIVLYHANSSELCKNLKKDKHGRFIYHYHKQNYRGSKTIIDMLEYIVCHDIWKGSNDIRPKLPRHTKKQKKAYKKQMKAYRNIKIKNVCNLIEKLQNENEINNRGRD